MSYTIVKSLSIKKGNDKKWRVRVHGTDNNVSPYDWRTCEYPKEGYSTKDEAIANIISHYLGGDFQRGNNKFAKFAQELELGTYECPEYNHLQRLRKAKDKAYMLAGSFMTARPIIRDILLLKEVTGSAIASFVMPHLGSSALALLKHSSVGRINRRITPVIGSLPTIKEGIFM